MGYDLTDDEVAEVLRASDERDQIVALRREVARLERAVEHWHAEWEGTAYMLGAAEAEVARLREALVEISEMTCMCGYGTPTCEHTTAHDAITTPGPPE